MTDHALSILAILWEPYFVHISPFIPFVKSGLFLLFFDWSTFCGSGYISLIPPYVVISRGREQSRRGPEGPPLVRQGRPSGHLGNNIYFYHSYIFIAKILIFFHISINIFVSICIFFWAKVLVYFHTFFWQEYLSIFAYFPGYKNSFLHSFLGKNI